MSLRAALDDVTGLGPFFAASANPAEVVDPTWRPVRELYTDPEPLAARIRQVADVLGGAEPRVAASIAHMGLAARLMSPLIAVASVHGQVPPWSPASLHWRRAAVGQWPLWESAEDEQVRRPDARQLPAVLAEALVEPHLAALATAVRALAPVSARTLWGNAASAVASAGRLVAQARPTAAPMARRVVAALLDTAPLAGMGTLTGQWRFRRRSCCLYYRIPGGGICGDCVLADRPAPPAGQRPARPPRG